MTPAKYQIASWCLMAIGLIVVLHAGLLGALLAGLLVHELVHAVAPKLRLVGATDRAGKLLVLGTLILIVGLLVGGIVLGLIALVGAGPHSIVALMQAMADLVEKARTHFPAWVQPYVPATAVDIEQAASRWLREHASDLRGAGGTLGKSLVHILVGMIIGGLLAYSDTRAEGIKGPLVRAMRDRAVVLARAFRRVMFAQARISALNTLFTGIYLLILLPLFGINLPFVKTMLAVTFIAGLIPLVGGVISNTVIVIVSLNASLITAAVSLVFLIVIHKLEYLLNARIIGTQIRARAWELLAVMLLMEATFGLPGLVAAPVYYAYLKGELSVHGAI